MDPTDSSCGLHSRRPQEQQQPCKASSIGNKFLVFFVTITAAALLVFFMFYFILKGHSRHSVYLLQGCLAVGLLEKSWWHYRIRHRFLTPLEASEVGNFGDGDPESLQFDAAEYDRKAYERMEPKTFAVNSLTDKRMKGVRGAGVIVAFLLASIAAAVSTIIAMYTEDLVVVCAAVGAFAGVLAGCLAPTPSDGVAILFHEGALTMAAMNTMIVHYTRSETRMVMLDYLFVALAGSVLIVISRVIVSKKLLECFFMVTLDTITLLHVTVIMMEVVDFVEHPLANDLPRELAAFFITIASAELGHHLFNMIIRRLMPHCFWHWQHMSPRLWGISDFTVSVLFGAFGMISWIYVGATDLSTGNIITLLGAVALSQMGRSFVSLIHETAMTPPWNRTRFTIWNNGIIELMNPFLVGWLVFYPYIKTFLKDGDKY